MKKKTYSLNLYKKINVKELSKQFSEIATDLQYTSIMEECNPFPL